jgi:hypothetical protein
MKTAIRWAPALATLALLVATGPALANKGGIPNGGVGQGGGQGAGHGKGNGGSKGTPAPIAGLGVLALGAIGYGTRKLRKNKQK